MGAESGRRERKKGELQYGSERREKGWEKGRGEGRKNHKAVSRALFE